MTISAAAFGRRINWEDDEPPPGHTLSFKQSIQAVVAGLFTKFMCPKWLFGWAPVKNIREARDGFAEFRVRPLRTMTSPLSLGPTYTVLFIGDDRRTQAFRWHGREEGSPLELGQCERGVLEGRRTETLGG